MDARKDILTKYEYAKVIGVRTEMLARGAMPMVTLTDQMKRRGHYDMQLVAEAEYAQGVIPLVVIRKTKNGESKIRLTSE